MKRMLFIGYYEIYPEKMEELAREGKKALQEPLPEGLKPIEDCLTPGDWGVCIFEAENEEAIVKYWAPVLRYFRKVKIAPAMRIDKMYDLY